MSKVVSVEFPNAHGAVVAQTFTNPLHIIEAHTLSEVRDAFAKVEHYTNEGYYAAGYVSYEAGAAFDDAMPARTDVTMPYVSFGIFTAPTSEEITSDGHYTLSDMTPSMTEKAYNEAIQTVHTQIYEGNTYQTNYTLRLHGMFQGDARALYTKLKRAQQANYCAYVETEQATILCASPELFFNKRGDTITARPMKGTVSRGYTAEQDEAQRQWLYESEKNRAENVMIVDLLRNDVGKIAQAGSVRVDELFTIEPYPTVHQMTSTVRATLHNNITVTEIFEALFPCGSITGAPKVKTMQLIQQLESTPRDVYCGAIGVITPTKDATFNVAIRTLVLQQEQATYGVGGGITWDSTAKSEFDEVLAKSKVLTAEAPIFSLLETLLLEHGQYYLLPHHMKRLAQSAAYFNRSFNEERIVATLEVTAQQYNDGLWRVRLVLDDEQPTIEVFPLTLTDEPMRAVLAATPIQKHNRFLYHKTTHRELFTAYQQQYAEYDDVLLWNEDGELTEFTNGNVVVQLHGKRYTPYVEAGLLAGTYRELLLQQQHITERVLTKDDLQHAEAIWFINSVRKWRPVLLQDDK